MPQNEQPVFIVGAPRTGSSFVCSALVDGAGLMGGAEGHILPLLADMSKQISGYYQLMQKMGMLDIRENTVAQIGQADLRDKIAGVFAAYYQDIYGRSGWWAGVFSSYFKNIYEKRGRWVDKTVNKRMIEALPLLLTVFPQARVIYLTRNGVRNVLSASKYFKVGFEEACRNWTQCGETWDAVADRLQPEKVLWIEHESLTERPAQVADMLAKHLDLVGAARESLLRFMVTKACEWVSATDAAISFENANLNPSQRAMFLQLCGEQMVKQGYFTRDALEALRLRHPRQVETGIALETVRVLRAEEPFFAEVHGDKLDIVPGKFGATLVMFEQVDLRGAVSLRASIGVSSPYSEGVRLEFIGMDCVDGTIVLQGQFELSALEARHIELILARNGGNMDLLIRAVQGKAAKTNDHSWAYVERMHLRREDELGNMGNE